MFLERFRNVVQMILTKNPQIFFGLRPDHGSPPLNGKSPPIRGANLRGGTYGYRLIIQTDVQNRIIQMSV